MLLFNAIILLLTVGRFFNSDFAKEGNFGLQKTIIDVLGKYMKREWG